MAHSTIRIGTRASQLAHWQANWVAEQLRRAGADVELVEVSTKGDLDQSGPIAAIGTQGVFTKEIQAAVLRSEVDLAVHSLKDLPTEHTEGLVLAAVPPRANVADALVSNKFGSLDALPVGATVGTGSLRRQAQLKHLRPDLKVQGIRGNVDTRLKKLDDEQFQAIVLAEAGLRRLGWEARITELLGPPRMLPAPGQGALGLECRAGDDDLVRRLSEINDSTSRSSVAAERTMLGLLHVGCSAPVGAWGRVEQEQLILEGLVASLDGRQVLRAVEQDDPSNAEALGELVAQQLLDQGAAELIAAAKNA